MDMFMVDDHYRVSKGDEYDYMDGDFCMRWDKQTFPTLQDALDASNHAIAKGVKRTIVSRYSHQLWEWVTMRDIMQFKDRLWVRETSKPTPPTKDYFPLVVSVSDYKPLTAKEYKRNGRYI